MDSLILWVKAAHIISVICWMCVLLYLPRLFVYHCDAEIGGVQSETFKVMEQRLLRFIGTPSMVLTWIFGLWSAFLFNVWAESWFIIKLVLVVILSALYMALAKYARLFRVDANVKSQKFYRVLNEIPAVIMILIVVLVVVKPFN